MGVINPLSYHRVIWTNIPHMNGHCLYRRDTDRNTHPHTHTPDGKGSSIHVLHGNSVDLCFVAEFGDGTLDVQVIHGLHVTHDGHHQALCGVGRVMSYAWRAPPDPVWGGQG